MLNDFENLKGKLGNGKYLCDCKCTKDSTVILGIREKNIQDIVIGKYDDTELDYILDFDTDEDIKVLQLTDTQVIDSHQCRTEDRLKIDEYEKWEPHHMDEILFDEIEEVIERTCPDFILITGDVIYGEFDDKGSSLEIFIEKMDSYKIPWAPIFGNHDNESKIGVNKQCEMFEKSKYCMFKRRHEIGGNGNYSIGIANKGKLVRTIFMMDSNGCENTSLVPEEEKKDITTHGTIHEAQLKWYKKIAKDCEVPSFLCLHMGAKEVSRALIEKGLQQSDDTYGEYTQYDFGNGGNGEDVFGLKQGSSIYNMDDFIYPHLLEVGTDGVFLGHIHMMSISLEWKGIRWTYGQKTGRYDSYPIRNGKKATGGTLITVNEKGFNVRHIII